VNEPWFRNSSKRPRYPLQIDANVRGLELIVPEVEPGLAIDADRQILAAAVANLLQNAFKFTRSHTRVSLRTFSSAARVLMR
jgi:signal transduction histidine kinase